MTMSVEVSVCLHFPFEKSNTSCECMLFCVRNTCFPTCASQDWCAIGFVAPALRSFAVEVM